MGRPWLRHAVLESPELRIHIEALQDMSLQLGAAIKYKYDSGPVGLVHKSHHGSSNGSYHERLYAPLIWTLRLAKRLVVSALDSVTHSHGKCKNAPDHRDIDHPLSRLKRTRNDTLLNAPTPTIYQGLPNDLMVHFNLFAALKTIDRANGCEPELGRSLGADRSNPPWPYMYFTSEWYVATKQEFGNSETTNPIIHAIRQSSMYRGLGPAPSPSAQLMEQGVFVIHSDVFDFATRNLYPNHEELAKRECYRILHSIWILDRSRQTRAICTALKQQLRTAFIQMFMKSLVMNELLLVELCHLVFDYLLDLDQLMCFNMQLRRLYRKKSHLVSF